MKKKGSVTVFICLFLAVFIGVMQVLFQSVQIAGGRVQAIAGVEEGLYSVFAQYDRELFETYHLFFVDGTYGTGELNLGRAYHIVTEQLGYSCSPRMTELDIRGENLWNCYFENGEITGYTLATDQNGLSFKRQAVDYMKDTLGIQGIQLLLNASEKNEWSITEDGTVYLEEGKNAQESYEVEINADKAQVDVPQEEQQVEVPDDFVNPLDVIKDIQEKGILSLVLPLSEEVSQESFLEEELISVRELETGFGIMEEDSEDIVDTLLFQEYLMTHLNCYTNNPDNSGIAYELEYVIAGKESDIDNLKSVVTRLLGIREAVNIVYLMKDPIRQSEIHQMSLLICTAIGLPALESVVSLALAAAWSFGESVLDVRQLLNGGNVPFMKSESTWKLSIEGLSNLAQLLEEDQKTEQEGMSYEQYLRILIGIQKIDQQVPRAMDIVENTMKKMEGKEMFRMDCCISYMEVNMKVSCNNKEYEIQRSYGYQM